MSAKKIAATGKKPSQGGMGTLFTKDNYKWMLIGIGTIALGFILMAGGHSTDPNIFNRNEVYSPMRITVAPIVILIGLAIEIYAIFRTPRTVKQQ